MHFVPRVLDHSNNLFLRVGPIVESRITLTLVAILNCAYRMLNLLTFPLVFPIM